MSQRAKHTLKVIGLSLAGLIVVILVSAVIVVQTSWFHNFVREKIVSVTEESTGGKVDVGSFDFDWTHLRATIRDFVIHGTEPANAAPLLRAKLIQVDLKLFSGLKKAVDLAALKIDQPQANVIVYPDGRTNVPEPKIKTKSDKTGLETIVDLAIGKFDVANGTVDFATQASGTAEASRMRAGLHSQSPEIRFSAQGKNLHAQLFYTSIPAKYKGQIAISPLILTSGHDAPINLNVSLPLVLEKDRIQLNEAKITTPQSQILISGAMEHLVAPQTSAHLNAHLSLDDVKRAAGNLATPIATGKDLPNAIDADIAMTMDQNTIKVSTARVTFGQSALEASGTLKDPSGQQSVQFNTTLALGQLGRLFKVAQQPEGVLQALGNAKLTGQSDYEVTASLNGRDLAFHQGTQRFSNIGLTGLLAANPRTIDLNKFKLTAFGGAVTGDARLENMERFQFRGGLHDFDVQTMARTFANQNLPYSGIVSGPVEATGNLKAPGVKGIQANARLAIAPGSHGVRVTGRLNADYNGAADNVTIANSYVALPNSRVDLNGAINKEIQLHFVSHDLNDFQPALAMSAKQTQAGKPVLQMPIVLKGGSANFDGTVNGNLTAPHLGGHIQVTKFAVEDRPFDSFGADVDASASGARIQNGSLARGAAQMQFTAAVGLHQWSAEPNQALTVNASIRNADMSDLLAIAGQKEVPITGVVNATAQIGGTVGNPRGNANLTVANGTAYDEHFDQLAANVDFADQLVRLSQAQLIAGTARIDLNGTFQHPRESFSSGTIQAHLASNQVSLSQFKAVAQKQPGLIGMVQLNGDVTASLTEVKGKSELLITAVNASGSAHGVKKGTDNIGDLTATAQTSGSIVNYNVNSDFAGSTIHVTGQTRLEHDYPTTANASITNLPIERVLALADRKDIPAKGILTATAQVSGTIDNPQGSADVNLRNAVLYEEPLDRLQARFSYSAQSIDIPSLEVVQGPNRIDFNGAFQHPAGDYENGNVRFHLVSNGIQLAQIKRLQQERPGLAGTLLLNAEGGGAIKKTKDAPQILLSSLNANIAASNIQMNRKRFGDFTATANSQGQNLVFKVDSDFAGSSIHGNGQAQLTGDYPIKAQLNFANVTYSGLQPFLSADNSVTQTFEAVAEGSATVQGPALKPEDLTGTLSIAKLQLATIPRGEPGTTTRRVTIQNEGPIVMALNRRMVNVQSAHLTGPSTDLKLTGSIALNNANPLNVQLAANTNLSILQDFNRDIYSAGAIAVNASVRGSYSNPQIVGQAELKNASFNMVSLPNGLSNANGTVVFNGSSATIRNLTGESGGGKVSLGGFVGFGSGALTYALRGSATDVRVRYEGASIVATAAVNLTGTSAQSALTGTVTLTQLGFNPKSDVGSLLSKSAPPATTPSQASGPLAGMKLDVRIRTSPDVAVHSALAQNIQADADLTLRGTPQNPGMVGRVNISSGNLVFFGTTYTINEGNVSFYNPFKIDPILNVDLEAQAQGVDVILTVSGPVNNMKLTYRSDPPLPFNEIIQLLATGRTPTSDPTILAHQPQPPPQNLQQMGESAIVSQAVANPVADRLSRVFGVSKLKIDPTFTSGSTLPQARLTLQQQVAQNVTFTYITDLTQSNSQIISVEWTFNPQWSAVATRDEYGRFTVDFLYKKNFR